MILVKGEKQAAWDRANMELYHVLYLCTTGAAANMAKKYKPRTRVTANGIKIRDAWDAKLSANNEQHRRALIRQLGNMMEEGTRPTCFLRTFGEDIKEPVSKARLADIIPHRLPASYDALRI